MHPKLNLLTALRYSIALSLALLLALSALLNQNNLPIHVNLGSLGYSIVYSSMLIVLAYVLQPSIKENFLAIKLKGSAFLLFWLTPLSLSLVFTYMISKWVTSNALEIEYGLAMLGLLQTYPLPTLVMLVLASYSEEIFFRLLPIRFMQQHYAKYPLMQAVIWQALFALAHAHTSPWFMLPFIFASGLFFWLGFVHQVGLHTIALAHACYNITSLLLLWVILA